MSGDVWLFLWLMVALKIPIGALLWLVWYASRPPEPEVADDNGGGGSDRAGESRPRGPRSPRRGPHGDPLPQAPKRVRATKGRTLRETPRG
jgi:hypothetical protein